MREETAGGVVDESKDLVHGVERKAFAVEKDGGTLQMDAMELLEWQEKDMYA